MAGEGRGRVTHSRVRPQNLQVEGRGIKAKLGTLPSSASMHGGPAQPRMGGSMNEWAGESRTFFCSDLLHGRDEKRVRETDNMRAAQRHEHETPLKSFKE